MRRTIQMVIGAAVLVATLSSCDQQKGANGSQPASDAGAAAAQLPTPSQPQGTSEEVLRQAAADAKMWQERDKKIRETILTQINAGNHLLFRDESAFYKWKGSASEGFVEAKGYYIDLRPQQVTEADRLNGATYVAKFYLTAPATRSYRRYMWGSEWRSDGWTRWAAPDPGLNVSRLWSMAEGTYEEGSQGATVKVSDWISWGAPPTWEEIEKSNPPK